MKRLLHQFLSAFSVYHIGVYNNKRGLTIAVVEKSVFKQPSEPTFHYIEHDSSDANLESVVELLQSLGLKRSQWRIHYGAEIPFQYKEISCEPDILEFEDDLGDFLEEEGIPHGSDPRDFIIRHLKIEDEKLAVATIKRKDRPTVMEDVVRFDAINGWRKSLLEYADSMPSQMPLSELLKQEKTAFLATFIPDSLPSTSYNEVAAFGLTVSRNVVANFNFLPQKQVSLQTIRRIITTVSNISFGARFVLIALLILVWGKLFFLGQELRDVSQNLNAAEYSNFQRMKSNLGALNSNLSELSKLNSKHQNIGPGLAVLIDKMPRNVRLKTVDISDNKYSLHGFVDSEIGAIKYVKNIEQAAGKKFEVREFRAGVIEPQRGKSSKMNASTERYEFFIDVHRKLTVDTENQ